MTGIMQIPPLLRQRLCQLYYEKAECWFQRDLLYCKVYASCIILIERSVFLARCLGFFTSLVRCVTLAPHDSNIDLKFFTRKSVDYFAFCICQYMVQFRQDHGFDPPCGSHQLPVFGFL